MGSGSLLYAVQNRGVVMCAIPEYYARTRPTTIAVEKRQMACKPGSVLRPKAKRWPFLWDVCRHTPHATYPDGYPETGTVPSLFGLAPDGACHAASVAGDAVRSYRTISTLPRL